MMAEQNRGENQGGSSERGFASMDEDEQREIASQGGSASGGNFKNDPERAAEAGQKGGEAKLLETFPFHPNDAKPFECPQWVESGHSKQC